MTGAPPINAVYKPATWKLALLTMFLLALGLVLIRFGQPAADTCRTLRPCAISAFGALDAGYLLLFVLIPFLLFSIIMGVPRLTLSDQGAVLQTAFTTRRAHWLSLGPFGAVKTRRMTFLQADVTGGAADQKSIQAGKLVILPASFARHPAQMVDELNARRAQALYKLGVIVTAPAAPTARRDLFPARGRFSLARAAAMFVCLWLPIFCTLVPLVGFDVVVMHRTGQHLRPGTLGGAMLLALAATALGTGWFMGTRSWRPVFNEAAWGMAAYLMSAEIILLWPKLAPNARIGLAIVALVVPLCLAVSLFTTRSVPPHQR